jgi:hypothetical protein
MDFILYYSLIYDNWAYGHDLSWRLVSPHGTYSREPHDDKPGGRYGHCCPNSQGYRDYTAAQLKELAENYQFESIFFDMTFWPDVCYCPNCQARWAKEAGGFMPRRVDWNDPQWNLFQQKREEWLHEYAMWATDTAKKLKPGVTVNHQGSVLLTTPWTKGVVENRADDSDYLGGDFYEGIPQQGVVCKLFGSLKDSFEFHTSRCVDLWDHTTSKSPEMIELQSCVALAHKGAFLFIDAIDPAGTLNPRVYENIGPIYQRFAQREKYLGGEIIADVAVLFDANSKIMWSHQGKPTRDMGDSWESPPMGSSVMRAATTLQEAHIPHTIIGVRNLKNAIEKYKVIILPDIYRLSDEAAVFLREYVEQGGAVYASRHSGLENLTDVLGYEPIGKHPSISYIAPAGNGSRFFLEPNPKYPLMLKKPQRLVKARPGTEVLATVTLPYHGEEGCFASIHSSPPGVPTDHPAIIAGRFGKGRTVYATGAIESSSHQMHKETFLRLIRDLAGNSFAFSVEGPAAIEAIAFQQNDGILVNLLNTQTVLPAVAAHGVKVTVDLGGKTATKVLSLPTEKELPFTTQGSNVTFSVPPVQMLEMCKVLSD